MIARTAKLDYKMNYLVVRSGDDIKRVFLDDIDTIIISTTAVSLTAYLLCELANHKINVVFCDQKGMPNGQYLPYYGSHDTSRKIDKQVQWDIAVQLKVWKFIITRKISGQAAVLKKQGLQEACDKLLGYISEINDGDSSNREGHAAKVYFNALFGKDFSRSDKENPINAELNYGYAILLSLVAREIVANGYITQIGIHHINVYNEYNLACDLMEPFRPFVDAYVLGMNHKNFGKEEKEYLVKILDIPVIVGGKEFYLSNAVSMYVKSITDALCNDMEEEIKYPEYELSLYATNSVF